MRAAYGASQTMNNPADIINVVIEELVNKQFELPAFNTLDRLVRHVRAKVNQDIFQRAFQGMKPGFIPIVMIWNTVYMAEIIEQFKEEGGDVKEDDLKHLSTARHEHINPYGKYRFDLNTIQNGQLRPLREKG